MNPNAAIEKIVLTNLLSSFTYNVNKLIEETERNEKYQSPELSQDVFAAKARVKFCNILLKEIEDNHVQLLHKIQNP